MDDDVAIYRCPVCGNTVYGGVRWEGKTSACGCPNKVEATTDKNATVRVSFVETEPEEVGA